MPNGRGAKGGGLPSNYSLRRTLRAGPNKKEANTSAQHAAINKKLANAAARKAAAIAELKRRRTVAPVPVPAPRPRPAPVPAPRPRPAPVPAPRPRPAPVPVPVPEPAPRPRPRANLNELKRLGERRRKAAEKRRQIKNQFPVNFGDATESNKLELAGLLNIDNQQLLNTGNSIYAQFLQKKRNRAARNAAATRNRAARNRAAAERNRVAKNAIAAKIAKTNREAANRVAKAHERTQAAESAAAAAQKEAERNRSAAAQARARAAAANTEKAEVAEKAAKNAAAAQAAHNEAIAAAARNRAAAIAAANAAHAKAAAAEARAKAAENEAKKIGTAAAQNAANRARANAEKYQEAARKAAENISRLILNALKNKVPRPAPAPGPAPGPAPKNKIPGNNNMKLNVKATGTGGAGGAGGTGGSITFTPTITTGGNSAALITALAQFTRSPPPTMNAALLQHLKNLAAQKTTNLTPSNKTKFIQQLAKLMQNREIIRQKPLPLTAFNEATAANINRQIGETKMILKLLGVSVPENKAPNKNKSNINKALNITNRFKRLQELHKLYKTYKSDPLKKKELKRHVRIVIRKMYGTNVSFLNANRNISNAKELLSNLRTSTNQNNKNITNNVNKAIKYLKRERNSKGKGFPVRRPVVSGSGRNNGGGGKNNYSVKPGPGFGPEAGYGPGPGAGYGPGPGAGYGPSRNNRGGSQPPVSITISNIGKVSNVGKVSNAGKVSNSGRVSNSGTTSNTGGRGLSVSAPTSNGNRQLATTSEQLIRGAGGAEAVEQGINALRAANGNVARAKAASRLPNNTFTNIYAMGGPVAAKRLVEQRRRRLRVVGGRRGHGGRVGRGLGPRVASKKKRVARKPKKYIKLTPYQFKRLTDHIKKNNLRRVLIKEITH